MKTLAILSQKGGVGKTTLAVHLAVAATHHGLQTAVFDLDPQAFVSTWADLREDAAPVIVQAQAPRLPTLLGRAQAQGADLVLIDSAPNADSAALSAAQVADLILVPCRPSGFDLRSISSTLNLAFVAHKPSWVLLNAVPSRGTDGIDAANALAAGNVQVVDIMWHDLVAFRHPIPAGQTAQEYDPHGKAAREVQALWEWVRTTLSVHTRIHDCKISSMQECIKGDCYEKASAHY